MMSAAVAGAAALVCSDISFTSAFRPLPFAGIRSWAPVLGRKVRRARVSASTLFAGLAGCLVKVGPVLALTGSTGQARRNADLDAFRRDRRLRSLLRFEFACARECLRAGRPQLEGQNLPAVRLAGHWRCNPFRIALQGLPPPLPAGHRCQIGPSPGDPGSIRNRQLWPVATTGEHLLTRMPSRQVAHALSKGNAASRSLVTASTRDPPNSV